MTPSPARPIALGIVWAVVIAGAATGIWLGFASNQYEGAGRHGAFLILGMGLLALVASVWALATRPTRLGLVAHILLLLGSVFLFFLGSTMCSMSFEHPCF
jgi:predicted transporter